MSKVPCAFERFLSTPSVRRATAEVLAVVQRTGISIHALREEGDGISWRNRRTGKHFYPRPP